MKPTALLAAVVTLALASGAGAQSPPAANPPPLQPLPTLDVAAYMGIWYQVAWFPNRFQKQCVSDTQAHYQLLDDGRVQVLNRCRLADGRLDEAAGIARPAGSTLLDNRLSPATLEVSFLPRLLRWIPAWGSYWVVQIAEDGRYAVVSEPQREYLWVLARAPRLSAEDEATIRSTLTRQGFELGRWQAHPHTP